MPKDIAWVSSRFKPDVFAHQSSSKSRDGSKPVINPARSIADPTMGTRSWIWLFII